jgi:hypothetical protein
MKLLSASLDYCRDAMMMLHYAAATIPEVKVAPKQVERPCRQCHERTQRGDAHIKTPRRLRPNSSGCHSCKDRFTAIV